MKRKKEFIIILASIVVIILSVSLAYFTTRIISNNRKVTVTSSELKIVFTSGTGQINNTSVKPGWTSGENVFTVTNETNNVYTYNLIIKDLVNTTVTEGFLVYKITSDDGGYNMSGFVDVPKSSTATDTILAENIFILAKTTHRYKIEIKYLSSFEVNQDVDQGKKLSGTLFIDGVKEVSTQNPTLADKILENNPTIGERTDFSTIFTTNTANTLYKATENGTDVYYFAGQDTESTPVNNWVNFGGFYWRIIRTNADGSIRLLYSGTSTDTTEGYIGTSAFNTTKNSPMYVGYMYGASDSTLEKARTNANYSTIKRYIEDWYENNLTSYTNYLSNDAIYCNDRELATGSTYSTSSGFYFKQYENLKTNKTPSYDCSNNKDAFSKNNKETYLSFPIALMTVDEVAYAGGVHSKNAPMWYYTNSTYGSITGSTYWWLISPYSYVNSSANVWHVRGSSHPGRLYIYNVGNTYGVRPVISLKACVFWFQGDGSANSPYEIVENSGC